MTLSAALVGKMVNGEAWYITYGKNSAAFFAAVKGAEPFANLKVTLGRGSDIKQITMMQADKVGNARVTMYSSIPAIQSKDLIEVWHGKECVASGYMEVVVPVID